MNKEEILIELKELDEIYIPGTGDPAQIQIAKRIKVLLALIEFMSDN